MRRLFLILAALALAAPAFAAPAFTVVLYGREQYAATYYDDFDSEWEFERGGEGLFMVLGYDPDPGNADFSVGNMEVFYFRTYKKGGKVYREYHRDSVLEPGDQFYINRLPGPVCTALYTGEDGRMAVFEGTRAGDVVTSLQGVLLDAYVPDDIENYEKVRFDMNRVPFLADGDDVAAFLEARGFVEIL